MAYLTASATGTGTIQLTIGGLENPANQYVQFQVNNNNTGAQYIWTSSSTGTSTSYTASGLSAGTTYSFTGYANWGGTNYGVGSASATTYSPSPVSQPSNISVSATGKTINMSWTKPSGVTYVDWEGDWGGSGWSSGSSTSTTAPAYNTTYQVRFKSEGNGSTTSDSSWTSWYSVTTGNPPPPVQPTGSVTLDTSYGNSGRNSGGMLYVTFASVTDATSYIVKARRGYDSYTRTFSFSSSGMNIISGLDPATTYYLSYAGVNVSGTGTYSVENQATTQPNEPSLSVVDRQQTQMSVMVTMNGGFSYVNVACYLGSTYIGVQSVTSNGGIVTFTGLTKDTQYEFRSRAYITVNSTDIPSAYVSIFEKTSARPAVFSWTYAKTSGSAFKLTATEWSGLVQNINDVRVSKGLGGYSWNYNAFTNIYVGAKFTANMYNEVWDAINSLSPPTALPSRASYNARIYANMLNGLVNSINSVQ